MKKLLAVLAVMGLFTLGFNTSTLAEGIPQQGQELLAQNNTGGSSSSDEGSSVSADEGGDFSLKDLHKSILDQFIDGGPLFMSFVLICLVLGLALCIERIIYLNMASSNPKKLLSNVSNALDNGGLDAAKEVARNTSGPVASIFYQALSRSDGSIEDVEKAVEQYGGVQMGFLEKGLSWISLFIALAPMLGFMGTVIGMIEAFSRIQEEGDIRPEIVAGGIKVALITTVSGLIVAIILQICYNYILSKIDGIVLSMEESSIDLVDMIYNYKLQNKA